MRKTHISVVHLALLCAVGLALSLGTAAQSNKPRGGTTPVTAEFRDSSGIPPDRIVRGRFMMPLQVTVRLK